MEKKIIKQNLRFYSKFLLLIGALIAFVCSFGVSSYAWSTDSNGNLVSDNLLNEDVVKVDTWTIKLGTANLQANVTYNLWSQVSFPEGERAVLKDNNDNIIAFSGWTFSGDNHFTLNSSYSGLLWLSGTFTTVEPAKFMLNVGTSSLPYEPYGVTYYPYSRVRNEAYKNYGVYQFIDNIKIEYNTGSSIGTYNTYTTPIISNPLTSPLSFSNGSLILSYEMLNDILEGSNNWYYVLTITFKRNRVKISDFNQWNISTVGNNLTFLSYSNTTYTKSNATGISYSVNLTDNGFKSSEYLKSITLNITSYANNNMFTQIGSPNDSLSYMYGYNYGYEKGQDVGFDDGFTDGKNEGYTMGYNDGYRDGTNEEFTTNGFKTLIGSIFNYPINMIKSIFNFEFMGINIYSIIVFIMSIGIVIFVIRRFKK